MIVMPNKNMMSFKIKSTFHKVAYFAFASLLHLCLVLLFSLSFYKIYFLLLVFFIYLLHLHHKYFSYRIFFLLSFSIVLFMQTSLYQNMMFYLVSYFNIFGYLVEVNSFVAIVLLLIHLLIFQLLSLVGL